MSVNQDLLGKVKQLEELLKRRNAENLELREELASVNKNMERSMQVTSQMSAELMQFEEKMLTTERENQTLKSATVGQTEIVSQIKSQ